MDEMDIRIGEALKHYRNKKNYSLQDVADRTGKSRYTIFGYEKGRNSLSASFLYQLCDLYECDIQDIFDYIKRK